MKEQHVASHEWHWNSARLISLYHNIIAGGFLFGRHFHVDLSLLMAARNQPQAAILLISIIKCGERTDRVVGIQFTIPIVLMPTERCCIAAHFESQLRGSG